MFLISFRNSASITIRNSIITIQLCPALAAFQKMSISLRIPLCMHTTCEWMWMSHWMWMWMWIRMYVWGYGAYSCMVISWEVVPNLLSGQVQRVHRKFVCCALICAFVFSWCALLLHLLPSPSLLLLSDRPAWLSSTSSLSLALASLWFLLLLLLFSYCSCGVVFCFVIGKSNLWRVLLSFHVLFKSGFQITRINALREISGLKVEFKYKCIDIAINMICYDLLGIHLN